MEPIDRLLSLIKERSNKIISDYQDEEGNGIDQEEANDLAVMILELNRLLSNGFNSVPIEWNKSK